MDSVVTIVNNMVYTWKFLREDFKHSHLTHNYLDFDHHFRIQVITMCIFNTYDYICQLFLNKFFKKWNLFNTTNSLEIA